MRGVAIAVAELGGTTQQIDSLNPYHNRWAIKARMTTAKVERRHAVVGHSFSLSTASPRPECALVQRQHTEGHVTHFPPDLKTRRSHTHLATQCGILLPVFRALVFGLALCFGGVLTLLDLTSPRVRAVAALLFFVLGKLFFWATTFKFYL